MEVIPEKLNIEMLKMCVNNVFMINIYYRKIRFQIMSHSLYLYFKKLKINIVFSCNNLQTTNSNLDKNKKVVHIFYTNNVRVEVKKQ